MSAKKPLHGERTHRYNNFRLGLCYLFIEIMLEKLDFIFGRITVGVRMIWYQVRDTDFWTTKHSKRQKEFIQLTPGLAAEWYWRYGLVFLVPWGLAYK